MSQTAIDEELEAEFAAVAAREGCELVHVESLPGKLRVFLDRPEGITVDDCQNVSKQLSVLLDVYQYGSDAYVLEVSSPGLDRQLFGPKDYERFRGRLIRVTYFSGQPRAKKTIVGRLEGFRPEAAGGGEIEVVEQGSGTVHEIALRDVKIARLEIEL